MTKEEVWVQRYRIEFDAFDAIKVPRELLEKHPKAYTPISEDEANRLNAAFDAAWPKAKP